MSSRSSSELELLTLLCGNKFRKDIRTFFVFILFGRHSLLSSKCLEEPGCPDTGKPHSVRSKSPHSKCRKPWNLHFWSSRWLLCWVTPNSYACGISLELIFSFCLQWRAWSKLDLVLSSMVFFSMMMSNLMHFSVMMLDLVYFSRTPPLPRAVLSCCRRTKMSGSSFPSPSFSFSYQSHDHLFRRSARGKASKHLFLGVSNKSVELDKSREDPILWLCGRPHLHIRQ